MIPSVFWTQYQEVLWNLHVYLGAVSVASLVPSSTSQTVIFGYNALLRMECVHNYVFLLPDTGWFLPSTFPRNVVCLFYDLALHLSLMHRKLQMLISQRSESCVCQVEMAGFGLVGSDGFGFASCCRLVSLLAVQHCPSGAVRLYFS